MKKIFCILIYSAITDFLVACIKLFGGFLSGCSSLIADALYTLSNFVTDIMALIGAKLAKKRPNKIHPFGFGKVEYVANIFIGFFIFLIGILMFLLCFQEKNLKPNVFTIMIILISIFLKLISSYLLFYNSKKEKNETLLMNSKIAFTDIYSTGAILIIIVLSFILKNKVLFYYIDLFTSIIIALHILKMAYHILKLNIIAIIGENDNDPKLIENIENEVQSIKGVTLIKTKLIKYGTYYKAELIIHINPNLKIKEFINIEKKINHKIKKSKYKIKYTTIEIDYSTKK